MDALRLSGRELNVVHLKVAVCKKFERFQVVHVRQQRAGKFAGGFPNVARLDHRQAQVQMERRVVGVQG